MKTCTRCGKEQPLDQFYPKGGDRQGYRPRCKTCHADTSRAQRDAEGEAGRIRRTERAREYRAANPEYVRRQFLTTRGLTEETAAAIVADGSCHACGRPGQVFDHDHDCCPRLPWCGKCVRGWLCAACNITLGTGQESPEVLRSLADYLVRTTITCRCPACGCVVRMTQKWLDEAGAPFCGTRSHMVDGERTDKRIRMEEV